jgi:hypothetical protein
MSKYVLKGIIGLGFMMGMLFIQLLFAQGPDTLWTRTYGGANLNYGFSVQQTADGGYIIAGYTDSFGAGGFDVYVIKTNSYGDTLWTKTYGGSEDDKGYSVQQTTDGGYIIVGNSESFGGGDANIYLIKTDANGDTMWTKTYGGSGDDRGRSVQQTTDGGYIIAGDTYISGQTYVILIKTDANGSTTWIEYYGGASYDWGHSVQQTTDGGYIIAGITDSFGAGNYDVYLIKTDANGDTLWTKTYGGTGYDYGLSVQQTTDDGYVIAGRTRSFGSGQEDVYLVKTNSNGDTLWTKTYGGEDADYGYSVQQTTDGGYVIAGYTNSSGASYIDVYLIKTDANGDTLWTKTYGGSNNDIAHSVQQTIDCGYIIAGYTLSFGGLDVYLIRVAGTLPIFTVLPTNLNFGDVFVDSSETDSVTVTNTGSVILNVSSVVSDNNEFTVTPNTGSIPPGDSMQFYITFAPVDTGMETGNIIFIHSAETSPDTVTVAGNGIVGIEEIKNNTIPAIYSLSQAYPNPFKTKTCIRYQLPQPQFVKIAIYNIAGQRIKTLIGEHKDAGFYNVYWDGKDENNQRVSNGVYWCRMEAGEYISVKRMLLLH